MGTSTWPPARTSTWPPAGTFPWPRTAAGAGVKAIATVRFITTSPASDVVHTQCQAHNASATAVLTPSAFALFGIARKAVRDHRNGSWNSGRYTQVPRYRELHGRKLCVAQVSVPVARALEHSHSLMPTHSRRLGLPESRPILGCAGVDVSSSIASRHCQYAPLPKMTVLMVRARIMRSSVIDQFST